MISKIMFYFQNDNSLFCVKVKVLHAIATVMGHTFLDRLWCGPNLSRLRSEGNNDTTVH